LASSLGYFMAPLLYVAVGAFHFKEQLSTGKRVASLLGMLAVLPLLHGSDLVTVVVAVLLAGTIVAYGFLRKRGTLGPLDGLFLESLVLTAPALTYMVWANGGSLFSSDSDSATVALLLVAGPGTLVPLLLFALAVRELPMSSIGFLQYVSPALQFLLAVIVFHEPVSIERLAAFGFVWAGIVALVSAELASRRVMAVAARAR
jgi:chloramphenicol-sensitive protein RarD